MLYCYITHWSPGVLYCYITPLSALSIGAWSALPLTGVLEYKYLPDVELPTLIEDERVGLLGPRGGL